jgi:hypothetical protein
VVHVRDALAPDNASYLTANVRAQLAVLIVDGSGERAARQSAAYYLRTALGAVGSAPDGRDALEIQTIRPLELAGTDLSAYRVALLTNVRSLPPTQVGRLQAFIESGGGLGVFLGAEVERAFYNQALAGLLPAEIGALRSSEAAVEPFHPTWIEEQHPVLQRFAGALRGGLARLEVYRAHQVHVTDAWTIAALAPDFPLFVERRLGQGRVLLCSTQPHPQWTNLPLRRSFVPLVSRMVSYLAGGGASGADETVGTDLVVLAGGWDGADPVYVERPDGVRLPADVQFRQATPRAILPAAQVNQAGFYTMEPPAALEDGDIARVRAVNVPASESQPQVLALAEREGWSGAWQLAELALDPRDFQPHDAAAGQELAARVTRGGPAGRGIWDALLWIVLALLITEPWLANLIRYARADEAVSSRRKAA